MLQVPLALAQALGVTTVIFVYVYQWQMGVELPVAGSLA